MTPLPVTRNPVPAFRELAKIKLGIKRVSKKSGNEYPVEVDHFRVIFNDGEGAAQSEFHKAYPEEPKKLRIVFPFNEVERVWDAWLKCFRSKRMVAKAGLHPDKGDEDIYFERLLDPETDNWIVKNWKDKNGNLVQVDMNENDGKGPVIWTNDRGDAFYLEEAGELRVVIEELIPHLGYCTMYTRSLRNNRQISAEIAGIRELGGGNIVGIPCLLLRRKEKSMIPGSNQQTDKYFVHVIVDPEYSKAVLNKQRVNAMLEAGVGQDVMLLGDGEEADPWDDEVVEEEFQDIMDGDFEEEDPEFDPPAPPTPLGEEAELVTDEDQWKLPGIVRTKKELSDLCKRAGIDPETALNIYDALGKDPTVAYEHVLKEYFGVESDG